MKPFIYNAMPGRVVFGSGVLSAIADEARGQGCKRVLVLSTAGRRAMGEAAVQCLGDLSVGLFDGAAMHTPVEVTERAMQVMRETGADGVVSIGGGSAVGLSKAIAARTNVPQIVVVTTYAGSEATPILGETREGVKTTRRGPEILPEVIVYDVDLTLDLPLEISLPSGINAMAHAVEGLYAVDANPPISLLAEEGLRAMASALPRIKVDPRDVEARSDALYGAWACSAVMGSVSLGLHHKLCHTLGGTLGLPHAQTHAVMLPYVTAFNATVAPEAMARIARALGVRDAAVGLHDLARSLGAPQSLQEIGARKEGLERVADLVVATPYPNPRPIERGLISDLLVDAYWGRASFRSV